MLDVIQLVLFLSMVKKKSDNFVTLHLHFMDRNCVELMSCDYLFTRNCPFMERMLQDRFPEFEVWSCVDKLFHYRLIKKF